MSTGARIKEWRINPCKFAVDVFGITLDAWQEDALNNIGGDYQPRRQLALKACTGPGKSAILAIAGWHRLMCFARPGEHPKGAALSGEGRDNLRDNLWAELSKWQQRSELLRSAFTWNKEQIYANDHPETWFLSARSYPKDADQEAIGTSLSGLHSQFPFVLLDETGKMPVGVGQKATQIFTGGTVDGLIIQAGNPTSTEGLLYESCQDPTTKVITITADPDDPKRTPRVDIEYAREQIKRYGRENPWVMATILGLFPPGGLNTLISLDEVEAAMGRKPPDDSYKFAQKRLGVDVARFGDDRTVIFPRQGLMAYKPVEMRGAMSHEVAARVALAKSKWGSELEFIDDTGGYGSGVVDSMIQAGHAPMGINFASKSTDPVYVNKRAEIWFQMAEWVKRGGCLPQIQELKRELVAPTYFFKGGKFMLEPKEKIKERLGFSPDIADALALTFSLPDMPARTQIDAYRERHTQGKVAHDWDPI